MVRRRSVAVHSAKTAAEEFCFSRTTLINYGVYAGIALLIYSTLLLLVAFGIYKCVKCCTKNANNDEENDHTNTNGV